MKTLTSLKDMFLFLVIYIFIILQLAVFYLMSAESAKITIERFIEGAKEIEKEMQKSGLR